MTFARLARCLTTTALGFVFATVAAAQPTIGGVANGASFQALVGPGCVMSIFGTELASSTTSATIVPLPTILDDVSVTVDGIPAPLFFISPGQINAQIPLELDGDRATVVVTTSQGQSAPFVVALQPTAPGIFTASADGRGVPLLLDTNFRVIESVGPGERAVLYATGLGPTSPGGTTGEGGAGAAPFNRLDEIPEVYIGGRSATVEFAGLAPGFVGVFQLNIVGPNAILGTRTYLVAGGRSSNATNINASFPDPVQGSDVLVTEMREVGEFNRIRLVGVSTVNVQVGQPTELLEIEAEDNLIGLINTEARDGVLRITATRPYFTNEGPTITVSTPSLDRVELLGVGSINATGVSGDLFEARLSGTGVVQASGNVEAVDVVFQGTGNAALFGLSARRSRVQLIGVGNVEVNASESLFARLSGVGNIAYTGGPGEVDTSVTGVGNIQGQ